MRFFTRLIFLVPLVSHVVAFPAITQDVLTITSDFDTIGEKFTSLATGLVQNSTNTDAAQLAKVSQLKFTLRSILPILIPFHA